MSEQEGNPLPCPGPSTQNAPLCHQVIGRLDWEVPGSLPTASPGSEKPLNFQKLCPTFPDSPSGVKGALANFSLEAWGLRVSSLCLPPSARTPTPVTPENKQMQLPLAPTNQQPAARPRPSLAPLRSNSNPRKRASKEKKQFFPGRLCWQGSRNR